ncbi:MAG: hypothetical protein ABFS12_16615 [Bacteroidota bacterium]
MKTIPEITWTKDEFKAYVLLFAANSDLKENRQEQEFILKRINKDTYHKIHYEFDNDNDFQSIQKILAGVEKFDYSQDEIEYLTGEIMKLLLADNKLDTIEQCVFMMLKKILKK